MLVTYKRQKNPNPNPNTKEVENVLKQSFDILMGSDEKAFDEKTAQEFSEWFSTEEMYNYLDHGILIEARDETEKLLGAAFIGKQNPISWSDGYKATIFILGVIPKARKQGIGTQLMKEAEEVAKELGAKKLLIDTNVVMGKTRKFYENLGYAPMGILEGYYDNGAAIFFSKAI